MREYGWRSRKEDLDGSAGQKIGKTLEATKPESAYFLDRNGERAGVLVFEMSDASKIPSLVETWMLLLTLVTTEGEEVVMTFGVVTLQTARHEEDWRLSYRVGFW